LKSVFLGFTALARVLLFSGLALNSNALAMPKGTSDAELVKQLKGFKDGTITTPDGIRVHYVEGGQGDPLILLPGWPQTWWEYHKIVPVLPTHFHVIAVDIRGMRGSSKPQDGYDKKTMAKDIYALVSQTGFKKVNIAGHDIGSMVGFAFAANYLDAIQKLALLEAPHPNEYTMKRPMLPAVGKFAAKIDEDHWPG
jgi:pimeloyl-ACP methyl ester carboxylesterase